MNFSDILALAKQGYKPADIKELLALEIHEPSSSPEELKDGAKTQAEPDAATDEPKKANAPDDTATAIDYKKLYETEKLKNEELQKNNINRNYAPAVPEKTEDEELADIVRGFM